MLSPRSRRALAGVGVLLAASSASFAVRDLSAAPGAPVEHRVAAGHRRALVHPIDPALFSPGACIAYPPTAGNRHEVVFLDAGHGGIDPGAVGTTESGRQIEEADVTLPVELDAMALLRAAGFTVVVSRTRASSVVRLTPADVADGDLTLQGALDDVAARDRCADRAKASLLVGIYFDAGASPLNAGSIAAYDQDRPFWRESLRLATLVQRDVLALMNARGWQIPNDGVVSDATLGSVAPPAPGTTSPLIADAENYHHLLLLGPAQPGYFTTPSTMPGTVVEPLFITDPFEATIAASSEGQHVIARAIAEAVEQDLAPAPRRARHGR